MSDTDTKFTVTVKPEPVAGAVPPIVRLRRWLKAGLRLYGLRCTEITMDAKPDPKAPRKAAA